MVPFETVKVQSNKTIQHWFYTEQKQGFAGTTAQKTKVAYTKKIILTSHNGLKHVTHTSFESQGLSTYSLAIPGFLDSIT
jgi:hypothetical protein